MALLERRDQGGIAHLTMTAPERLNALSDDMLEAFQDQIDSLALDHEPRVVILSGAGKAFCAGHDLKEMQAKRQSADGGAAAFRDLFNRCAKVMMGLQSLPQPVIAQVHGIATAAGCQLVATCDLAVATNDTRFGVNGVNIGLFCSTPMVALTRAIGRKKAFEMLTTGQFISADEACRIGLINHSVSAEDLEATTKDLAETLAAKLTSALRIGKRTFYDQAQMTVEKAYDHAAQVMTKNMLDARTEEGITAFLEKRPPDWA
ncbi:enoyl-CoA hydratase [Aestuariibius insulae]|uniref:enoyl-CoA hydratase n=1 Tax=Aestuariibius insulae TaxID=2058287 RepID=UPI00345E811F